MDCVWYSFQFTMYSIRDVHEAFQAEAKTEALTHETEASASWSEARPRRPRRDRVVRGETEAFQPGAEGSCASPPMVWPVLIQTSKLLVFVDELVFFVSRSTMGEILILQ